jgi:voltage-gated potassium channel
MPVPKRMNTGKPGEYRYYSSKQNVQRCDGKPTGRGEYISLHLYNTPAMYYSLKKKTHLLLDPIEGGTLPDKIINSFIVSMIVLNMVAVILETVDSLYKAHEALFKGFEFFSITIFSVEYILRVWSCTDIEKYRHPLRGRIKYILSAGGLIDLLAVLPFYLPLLIKYDLRILRALRLVRFLRFFKLGRYLQASRIIARVFRKKRDELVLSLAITFCLIIIASCLMYFTEHDAQPDKFSSIPETMWWSVATLTTVGYGDVYPITVMGKILTACISILGIGMFALPAGILASGFADEFKREKKCCPHCGKKIDD